MPTRTRDNDGRKLDRKTLEGIRLRVVQQVAEGRRPEEVAATLGFSRATVFSWVAKYRAGGAEALRTRKAPGRTPRLSPDQLTRLRRTIVDADPRQSGLPVALWTRVLVGELVQRECDVRLSPASIGRLLDRLHLLPPHPLRGGRSETTPSMRQRHRSPQRPGTPRRSGVHFVTETVQRYCGDQPPVTLIAAAVGNGPLRFAAYQTVPGPDVFIDFCRRLMHDVPGPLLLVVLSGAAHRSGSVARFVKETEGRLQLSSLR
ncbi:transposase [Micromonospora sp. C31]|uniref:helix-turn-helix domain-containing protein n=1 Tax=Micromonospora sp. C31 TaxID=2824876 RepID=UPI001B37A6B4|nr:helix-turn-helix domain-containing protein [Micromonospora sp. C31]MBQ1075633.1 transposase [Micromonospora sp. C31]